MRKTRPLIIMMLAIFLGTAAAWAERLSVSVPLANVRQGPGTEYKLLWKVEKYHPVEVVQKKGGWVYFRDFEGDKAWVYGKLVDDVESVIVVKDKVNVRSGPGTNHDVVFTVEKGVPFRVLGRRGDWIEIQHADGDKGWIHKNLVW